MQRRILLRGEFPPREHDHRNIGQRGIRPHFLEHLEAGHVRQLQVEHEAIDRIAAHGVQRMLAAADGFDLDVVMAEQLGDADLLRRIVLDDQEPTALLRRIVLDALDRLLHPAAGRRLVDERERAARQRVLAILVER